MTDQTPSEETNFRRFLLADLSAAIDGVQEVVTLSYPRLEYRGVPDLDFDSAIHWSVDIVMEIEGTDGDPDKGLNVGILRLLTAPIDGSLADTLDAISADTAAFLGLVSRGQLREDVENQFDDMFPTGMLILDRAYIDPGLRGHDLGAWAVTHAIRHLTYGAQVLAVALPSPTEKRPGVTEAAGAKKLAKYWAKAGLEAIKAAPRLVGQYTASIAFENACDALADVSGVEITLRFEDMTRQQAPEA